MKPPMLLAFAVLSTATAQATEPTAAEPTGTVTLACEGTASASVPSPPTGREPVSVGIVLNFAAKSVALIEGASKGLGWRYPIRIDKVSELAVSFGSADEKAPEFMWGIVGRVSGDAEVYHKHASGQTHYSLKCRPTQRIFSHPPQPKTLARALPARNPRPHPLARLPRPSRLLRLGPLQPHHDA